MSNGTPNASSRVSILKKVITPSGQKASQGCKEISTTRSVVSDKDGPEIFFREGINRSARAVNTFEKNLFIIASNLILIY